MLKAVFFGGRGIFEMSKFDNMLAPSIAARHRLVALPVCLCSARTQRALSISAPSPFVPNIDYAATGPGNSDTTTAGTTSPLVGTSSAGFLPVFLSLAS